MWEWINFVEVSVVWESVRAEESCDHQVENFKLWELLKRVWLSTIGKGEKGTAGTHMLHVEGLVTIHENRVL